MLSETKGLLLTTQVAYQLGRSVSDRCVIVKKQSDTVILRAFMDVGHYIHGRQVTFLLSHQVYPYVSRNSDCAVAVLIELFVMLDSA